VTRDVLAWIVPVLTVWLAIGVLTARLFGALVTDEDDQELTKGSRALIEPGGLSVGPLISDRPVEASILSSPKMGSPAGLFKIVRYAARGGNVARTSRSGRSGASRSDAAQT
jgi:hypothetical protein